MKPLHLHEDVVIKREDGWLAGRVGDDLVMMHAKSNQFANLSATGSRIWELLEGPRTLKNLCETLSCEYDITAEEAMADITKFLRMAESHNLLHFEQ